MPFSFSPPILVFKTTTPTAQGKAPLTCPSCGGTRYVIIIITAYVYVCDPLAHRRRRVVSRMRIPLRRRPLGRGHASRRQWHHQPATHITGSWCATIIAYTWTDSCQDFTRCSRTLPPLSSYRSPPAHANVPEEKSPEKKRVFRPFIYFFGYFNVFAPSTSFRHVPLIKKNEK